MAVDPDDAKLGAMARAAAAARRAEMAKTSTVNTTTAAGIAAASGTPFGQAGSSKDEIMLAQLEAQLAKQKATLAELEKIQAAAQAEANIAKGLNADGTRKTVQQRIEENRIERETTQAGLNPDNPMPSTPPAVGYKWANYGGVWKQYPIAGFQFTSATGATGGGGGGGGGGNAEADALKALLEQQKAATEAAAKAKEAERMASKIKASDRLTNLFKGYGIEGLATFINQRIMEDASEESVLIELYDRPEYKVRFPGMEALRKKNRTITEKEYIDIENAFVQTARFFDIPKGFYDSADDFGNLIGNEVSAKEFQDRLQVGQDVGKTLDPNVRAALKDFYGIGEGGITAYVLNADKALPILQKQAKAATIAGVAKSAGFNTIYAQGKSEELAGMDAYSKLSEQQLQQGFGIAQQQRGVQQRLARIEGTAYNEQEALQATIEGSAMAQLESKKRAEREAMFRFGGRSGVGSTSLRSTTNQ